MAHDHRGDFACRCPHRPFDPAVFRRASSLFDRRTFLAGLGASAAAVLSGSPARAADNGVTVLRAARLFDGIAMRAPGVLVLRGDRIVSMNAGDAGSDARTVDLGDATLMPGLIDAHTHVAAFTVVSTYLVQPGRSADSVAGATLLAVRNAQSMLANGFTTVRDVGGGEGIDLAMRDAVASGTIVGPRILAAGPALSITGGHGDANDLPPYVHVDREIESGIAYGPYGFRERVREHVKRHVDVIKILMTGGVLSYGDTFDVPQFNLDEVQATVDEAAKFGLKVAAHCHGDRGIRTAVDGGVHSVEHCTGVGDATLHAMRERGTALVPTIWALDSILQPGNPNHIEANPLEKAHQAAKIRDAGMQRAIAANARIVYGTDAGVFPHRENNKDFALLQSMGMRPLDLLRSATSHAAELIGTSDRGRLAPGMLADVVAFRGDPSANAGLLEKPPALVVLGGRTVERGAFVS
ncbi:MAG TPA: amidohydrolase family protein [Candidatus Elarobacter sp.]|jgi:imidazolonepropionase-like amidohydrolase|nr:amidohydrolase family protein [Candidatus Elarobacter sp.]